MSAISIGRRGKVSGSSLIIRSVVSIASILLLFSFSGAGFSQEEELEFIDSVTALQEKLKSDSIKMRDEAEKELLRMGADVLPYLDSITSKATADFQKRMTNIRTKLEKRLAKQSAKGSRVTLNGKITLEKALSELKRQTGNQVELQEMNGTEADLEFQITNLLFWDALAQIMQKAKLKIDRYGSQEPGQLVLTSIDVDQTQKKLPSSSAEIFQVQVLRVDSSINLEQPEQGYTLLNLLVRWEPRLLPISVDIPMTKMSIRDEFDDAVMLPNTREVLYGVVQPEIPELEFPIRLPRIDRQVENLKSMSFQIDTVLPGKPERFRLPNLGQLKPGAKFEKASANLSFGGIRKNEDVYSVKLSLSFDEENNALESHQGWVFQNQVFLEDSQGNRENAITLESLQHDNERVTVNYYFVSDPSEQTLFYSTPTSIMKLPVKIDLGKISLP